MRKPCVILTALLLSGCATQHDERPSHSSRALFEINQTEKRLNTASCSDQDDWYLDGFRVGKMHPLYKQQLFTQRVHYCESIKPVSEHLKAIWESGFKNGNVVKPHKRKKKSR